MYKIILTIIIALLLCAQSASALNLNLKSIDEDRQEATLLDRDTENEWVVTEGDEIEGWVIMEINENNVLIKKKAQGKMKYGISKRLTLPKDVSPISK